RYELLWGWRRFLICVATAPLPNANCTSDTDVAGRSHRRYEAVLAHGNARRGEGTIGPNGGAEHHVRAGPQHFAAPGLEGDDRNIGRDGDHVFAVLVLQRHPARVVDVDDLCDRRAGPHAPRLLLPGVVPFAPAASR